MNFVDAAKSANHCQRNWSDKKIDETIIEELISVAVNMPTKQNQNFYSLIVSCNQKYNEYVYLNGYDTNEQDVMSLPFEQRHRSNFNSQLRAPLLFQWVVNEDDFTDSKKNKDTTELKNGVGHISVGISAGAVSLTANLKGLKTGFCICLDQENVRTKIKELTNLDVTGTFLTLGIGYPRDDLPHNFCVRPDGSLAVQQIYKKDIQVIRL